MRMVHVPRFREFVATLLPLLLGCGSESPSASLSGSGGSTESGQAPQGGATRTRIETGGNAGGSDPGESSVVISTPGGTAATDAATATAGGTEGESKPGTTVCSAPGSLSCSENDPTVVLRCGAEGTWIDYEHCESGKVCDNRENAVPECVVPDAVCESGEGTYCADATAIVRCNSRSLAGPRGSCPSRICENNVCVPWQRCTDRGDDVRFNQECIKSCGFVSDSCVAIGGENISVAQTMYLILGPEVVTGDWDIAIPPASTWPTAAGCPEVRWFVVSSYGPDDAPAFVNFEVPEQYWVVQSSIRDGQTLVEAVDTVCNAAPMYPIRIDFDRNVVAIIATKDEKAPAFWLALHALWGESAESN